mmetsp:Transcript_17243/g.60211  ORF Transcript_17243/g.60211 Transcript_17243/m.60211 type:complete len:200 (+) Transcript_17243:1218-1817(+)
MRLGGPTGRAQVVDASVPGQAGDPIDVPPTAPIRKLLHVSSHSSGGHRGLQLRDPLPNAPRLGGAESAAAAAAQGEGAAIVLQPFLCSPSEAHHASGLNQSLREGGCVRQDSLEVLQSPVRMRGACGVVGEGAPAPGSAPQHPQLTQSGTTNGAGRRRGGLGSFGSEAHLQVDGLRQSPLGLRHDLQDLLTRTREVSAQ